MSSVEISDVTYTFPGRPTPALEDVSLSIDAGELAVLAGPSGGGKSTLLRLVNGLVPHFHGGIIRGSVTTLGMDTASVPPRQLAAAAGMVFQEPEAQSLAETVLEEVAFGLEQHAIARPEMHRRIHSVLAAMGIEHLRDRRISTLSGGERQRLALASVLALEPGILLLDEPTSQLDREGAESLVEALLQLHGGGDLAILIAEHRLDRLLPVATRVLSVNEGRVCSMAPRQAATRLDAVPAVTELSRRLGESPWLTVEEARAALPPSARAIARQPAPSSGDVLLEAFGVHMSYGPQPALSGVSFAVREGEVVALVGPNGSGKSSLFRAITGLSPLAAGSVRLAGADAAKLPTRERTGVAGLVPQNPALALYRESVAEEIDETLRHRRSLTSSYAAMDEWGIAEFAVRNPRDVSVGQQERIAIAAMLAHRPKVWLLDEPTRGADSRAKAELADRLRAHAAAGGAAIVATHDIESAARFASRVLTIEAGGIVSDLPAHAAFAAGGPHPTQVAQVVPGAIVPSEVTL